MPLQNVFFPIDSVPTLTDTIVGVKANGMEVRWTTRAVLSLCGQLAETGPPGPPGPPGPQGPSGSSGGSFSCINVKTDYGAVGDGVHDDTINIQNAFDAAFGTSGAPHGQTQPYANKNVYIPAGRYKITATLFVTQVFGGRIFGDGQNQTQLIWGGSYPGNSLTGAGVDNTITPMFVPNGFAYSVLEKLYMSMADPTGVHNSACIYWWALNSSSPNEFRDLFFQNCNFGVYAPPSPNNVSECLYTNVLFDTCASYGLRVLGFNTLNHWVVGGGANFCGFSGASGAAAYSVGSGAIPLIKGAAFHGNFLDVYNAGTQMIIDGARTESGAFVIGNGGDILLRGCTMTATKAVCTITTSGTTMTISAVSQASNVGPGAVGITPGMFVYANDGTNHLPNGGNPPQTFVVKQLTGSPGALGTYQLSSAGTPGNLSSTSAQICPLLLGVVGVAELNDCPNNTDGVISTSNNTVIRVTNNSMVLSTNTFTGMQGLFTAWDEGNSVYTVAALPAAASYFKGIRLFVTDSNLSGTGNTNFGTDISGHGGGTNTVPVWCDGSAWRIG